jgi:hypothetical protein
MGEKSTFKYYLMFICVIALCCTSAFSLPVFSAQSNDYILDSDVRSGGGGGSDSIDYYLDHTTGQPTAIGISSDAEYVNSAGFWYSLAKASVKTSGMRDVAITRISAPKKARNCGKPENIGIEINNNGMQDETGDVILRKDGIQIRKWTNVLFGLANGGKTTMQYMHDFSGDGGKAVLWEAEVIVAEDNVPGNNSKSETTNVTTCKK